MSEEILSLIKSGAQEKTTAQKVEKKATWLIFTIIYLQILMLKNAFCKNSRLKIASFSTFFARYRHLDEYPLRHDSQTTKSDVIS